MLIVSIRQRPQAIFEDIFFKEDKRVGTRFVRCYFDSLSELLLGMISGQKIREAPELLHKKVAIQALHSCRVVFVLKQVYLAGVHLITSWAHYKGISQYRIV